MKKRHEPESPWASFADALSGMLFVFVITTFWFAWQEAKAVAQKEIERDELVRQQETITRAKKQAQELMAEHGAVTECLRAGEGHAGSPLDVSSDPSEARISIYVQGVDWFVLDGTSFKDDRRAAAGIERIRTCIEELVGSDVIDPRELLVRVYLEGHTDALQQRGTGGRRNWELSGARASTILFRILNESEAIRAAQDKQQIELLAVGVADRRPAWRRICERAETGQRDGVDDFDRIVCDRGGADPDRLVLAIREELPGRSDLFAQSEQCGRRGEPVKAEEVSSDPGLLRLWANRCVEGTHLNEERLGMLRRVDLRLELVPRGTDDRPAG